MVSRTFTAHSPLGDQLEFRSMEGVEQLSKLFEFRVRLISESQGISAKALLGKDMSIEIDLTTEDAGSGKRYISGQVTQFTYAGRDGDFYAYVAVLRPWLWHATRRSDFKIFQFMKVPDIIKDVLAKYGFSIEDKLTGTYREWTYMVQHGESDFNFVSRLMESEGIYTYYQHSMGSHALVLADDIGSHSPLPNGPSTIPYYPESRAAHIHSEDFIDEWGFAEDIASGHFEADDYDFKKPKAELTTRQQQPAGHTEDSREMYEWPGGYTDVGDGENYARVRIEQQKAEREVAHGAGNARNIAPGYFFTFSKYPRADQNKEYLVEMAHYQFEENVRRSDGAGGSGRSKRAGIDSPTSYRVSFGVVPKTTPYRSQRITPKPHTNGPQTAVVTGPAGEEIYTNEFGQVKVQFHWDRYGSMDENSSCWIRVSQTWAGAGYGSMHIPRIGQEVIVDFLNGDPDYPIITGRVYNAMQMPAWQLPKHKTQSGTQTNWSKGGGGKNMLRFEDQKGIEHLELSSDHGNTHLHMGYLMNQSTEAKRSYGFELRTNEWGAIRADKGLLITTYTQDFKSKITHDNPDGFSTLADTLKGSSALIDSAKESIGAMNSVIENFNQVKMGHMSELASNIQSMVGKAAASSSLSTMASAIASFVSGGSAQGSGPEQKMPLDPDPAIGESQDMHNKAKDINKPIVSVVSPEGHVVNSPKPVVIGSGQSISIRGTGPVTAESFKQFSVKAGAGMITTVSGGGQRTSVNGGDIGHFAETGSMTFSAKGNVNIGALTQDVTVAAKEVVNIKAENNSVMVGAGQHIQLKAAESITFLVGDNDAYIKLIKGGKVEIFGKDTGVIDLVGLLDIFGKKINLNCSDE